MGAVADGGEGDGNVVDGGDHHDGHVGKFFLGAFEEANAVEVGHHQIGKHELEYFTGIEQGEGFQARAGLLPAIAGGSENSADNLTDCLFVVDYENTISHGPQSVYSAIQLWPLGAESNHPGSENAWIKGRTVIFKSRALLRLVRCSALVRNDNLR
jgi:hypothetical protein